MCLWTGKGCIWRCRVALPLPRDAYYADISGLLRGVFPHRPASGQLAVFTPRGTHSLALSPTLLLIPGPSKTKLFFSIQNLRPKIVCKKNICLNISGHRSGKFLDSSQFSCHSCQFISHFTATVPGTAAQEEILITRCNICKNIPGHRSGEFHYSSQFSCCSCQLISHFMATVPVTTAQEETLIGKSCSCDGRKA